MHPAQKRAIIAIISLVEQGMAQIKSMLVTDDHQPGVSRAPDTTHHDHMHLSDKDDLRLEEEMEHARMQMLQEDERAANEIMRRASPEKTFQGRDPLRFFEGEDQ